MQGICSRAALAAFFSLFAVFAIALSPTPLFAADSCDGASVVTDPSGDATNPAPGGQGPTSQADITAVSFSATATTLTTKLTIANLTQTPSPGTGFTSYYVVWTSTDGTKYGTEVDVDAGTIFYYWGKWNSANSRLSTFNAVTGTFTAGANGSITVPVPRASIGNPTIPIIDSSGTAAVTDPFAYTIAGAGAVGTGPTFTAFMDRAPNAGSGSRAFVCPDADGDGVTDADDRCPNTPPGTRVDPAGCPILDSDNDGVPDGSDQCPGTPAGTAVGPTGCPVLNAPEIPLHFHGNRHETPTACSGVGNSDFAVCSGPFLKESGVLDPSSPSAHFDYNETTSTTGQGPSDANWTWKPNVATTVNGYTVVNFWASCNAECIALQGKWDLRLFKNNTVKVFEILQLRATPASASVPSLLSVNFTLPAAINLNGTTDTLTLKLEAHFSDTGAGSSIYYDSVSPCLGASGNKACDSVIIFNAVAPTPPAPPPPPTPASGLAPRYQIHVSPPPLGNSAGEPSVGFNPFSKRTMFISLTQALRETYPELSTLKDAAGGPLPQACDATWLDKSGTLTKVNSLDPILFTDQATGRTFNSQLSGDNSLLEFTDNDGDTWTPGQAGPPNGGADHQTIATGPYPAGQVPPNALWPATGPKRAVYYCSQSVEGAFCSRSDDGGQTFGPGFPFKDPDCAAGALHGHVKVASDGTVYVPDTSKCIVAVGDTATHVLAFVSKDAGKTFATRPIPQSKGGGRNDPSIAIATDRTAYMCYQNADNTLHVVVSGDSGLTWQGGQDIGAGLGIVQTRFPQMIAGDPDRAACAFLGTTTAGNGDSMDFKGVWYGYVATTFDKGATWHLVNVTPNDPVQGFGGIGPSGTNRNLLDFNDLQLDEQGRTLFAFADGCIEGCVKDPSANSFARKATIVRQVGGRTLYKSFDDVATTGLAVPRYNTSDPIKPAPACARQDKSVRTDKYSDVIWNAPDTGGSPITSYKVYRALAPNGPYDFIGDAGTATELVDTSPDPMVAKYYYKVVAENALGIALDSNVIELTVTVAPVVDTCKVPGEIIITDATGDGAGDDTDIVFIAVAEPEQFANSFVITEKIKNFSAGQPPPNSFYPILFPLKGNLYISLDATQGLVKFTQGTYQDVGQGVLAFTERGTLPGSKFAADGTITLVAPRTLFGSPAVGAVISGFDARARVGSQSATSRDTAGPGSYTVRGTAICNKTVLASLAASLNSGDPPLDVSFTLSGTPPAGKTLASYSILFGDEPGASPSPTTGSFGGQGSVQLIHRYLRAGTFRAQLTVTDSAGNTSTNLAEQTITVNRLNQPPVANAGQNLSVGEGASTRLDGSKSSDPDGDALSYSWAQLIGPPVTLSDNRSVTPRFTAPAVTADTTLVFRLTVSDPGGLTSFSDVTVLVVNAPGLNGLDTNNRVVGGSLPMFSLLLLGLVGGLRLRSRQR